MFKLWILSRALSALLLWYHYLMLFFFIYYCDNYGQAINSSKSIFIVALLVSLLNVVSVFKVITVTTMVKQWIHLKALSALLFTCGFIIWCCVFQIITVTTMVKLWICPRVLLASLLLLHYLIWFCLLGHYYDNYNQAMNSS